jgi:hypothetical protein
MRHDRHGGCFKISGDCHHTYDIKNLMMPEITMF